MRGRRTRARRPSSAPANAAGAGAKAAPDGAATAMRQARASERRFISSCVIRRCNVFSALPGSDMKRKPSW